MPIGYVEGSLKNPEDTAYKIGDIWELFVKKEFRGRGVITMLKNRLLFAFKRKGAKFLSVTADIHNKTAHEIYIKWGFSDDAIKMMKRL